MYFRVVQPTRDTFAFQVVLDDGRVCLSSVPFADRAAALRGIQAAITSLREGVQATLEVEGEQYRCAIRGADGAPLATGAPLSSPAEVDAQLADLQHWVATVERFRIEEPQQSKGTTRGDADPAAGVVYDLERPSRTRVPGLELVDLPGDKLFSAQINDERGEPILYLPRFPNRFARDEQVEALLAVAGDKRRYDGREAEGRLFFVVTARNGRELARSKWFATEGERTAAVAWLTLVAKEEGRKFAAGTAQREAGAGPEGGGARPAGFEGFRGGDGQHYFRLNDERGEEVLTSHGYGSAKARDNGIRSLLKAATDPTCYRVAADGTSFQILALNGRQLARSRNFADRAETDRVIAWIRREVIRFGRACGIRLWESMIIEIPHEGEETSEPLPPPMVEEEVSRPLRELRVEAATEMAAAPPVLGEADATAGDAATAAEAAAGEALKVAEGDASEAAAGEALKVAEGDASEAAAGEALKVTGSEASSGEALKVAGSEASSSEALKVAGSETSSSEALKVAGSETSSSEATASEALKVAESEATSSEELKVAGSEISSSEELKVAEREATSGEALKAAGSEASSGEELKVAGREATSLKVAGSEASSSEELKAAGSEVGDGATAVEAASEASGGPARAASDAGEVATAGDAPTEATGGARDVVTTPGRPAEAASDASGDASRGEDELKREDVGAETSADAQREIAHAEGRAEGEAGEAAKVGEIARDAGEGERAESGDKAIAGTREPEPGHPVARTRPEHTLPTFVPPVATDRQAAGQASAARVPTASTKHEDAVPKVAAVRATERMGTPVPEAGAARPVTPVPGGTTRPAATIRTGATQSSATVSSGATQASATVSSGATQPATVSSGATQPATVSSGTTQPATVSSGTTQPATVSSGATQASATVSSGATRPAAPVSSGTTRPAVRMQAGAIRPGTSGPQVGATQATERAGTSGPQVGATQATERAGTSGPQAGATRVPAAPAVRFPPPTSPPRVVGGSQGSPAQATAPAKPSVRGWTMLMEGDGEAEAAGAAPGPKPSVPAAGKPSVRGWTMLMEGDVDAALPEPVTPKPSVPAAGKPSVRGWTMLMEGGDEVLPAPAVEKPAAPVAPQPSARGWTMLMEGGEDVAPVPAPEKAAAPAAPQPSARGWTMLMEGDDEVDQALANLGEVPQLTPERPLAPIGGEAPPPASPPSPRREEPPLLEIAREPVQAKPGPTSRSSFVPTMAPLVLEKSGAHARAADKPKTLLDLVDLPVADNRPGVRESQANPMSTKRQLPTLMPEDVAGPEPPKSPSVPGTSAVSVPEPVREPDRGIGRRMIGGIFLVLAVLLALYFVQGREGGGRGDARESPSKREERVAPPEAEPPGAAEQPVPPKPSSTTARVTSTPVPTGCPPEGASDPAIGIAVAPFWPVAGQPLRIVAATLADEQPVALRILGADDQPVAEEVEVEARVGVPASARATWTPKAPGVYRVAVTAGGRRACQEVRVEKKRERRVASVGPTGAWPVERAWTAGEEALYSAWIRELFATPEGAAATFARLDKVTGDPGRNFLHNALGLAEDSRGVLRLASDGDDLPYMLRAYWAWKRRLPFAFRGCSDRRGEPPQCGAARTNVAVGRGFSSRGGELGRIQRFFKRELPAGVNAGNARTANGDPRSDLYPVRIDRRGLRPGTLYVDPRGPVFIVVELVDRREETGGMVMVVDGQPDGTIVRRRFWEGTAVWHPEPALGGTGFKRFRPVVVDGGAVVQLDDEAIADVPSHADLWRGHAELGAQDFYDAVSGAVDPPPRDPERVLREAVAALFDLVQERVGVVERGAAYVRKKRKPLPMPAGLSLFVAGGAWDEHATPARDLRLLAAIDSIQALPDRVRARPELFTLTGEAEAAAAQLERSLAETLANHRFSYRRSDGSRQELSLADVVARAAALERAYNPNDCPELRWGAEPGSEEAATCSFRAPPAQQVQMERQREWFRARRPQFGRSP